MPGRPGPDRPVGRFLLTADLTRWADATARLFTELESDELGHAHAGHLEELWVLEDDHS